MKLLIPYLLGVLTPVVLFILLFNAINVVDWLARRRYIRAWKKFTAEWETLNSVGRSVFVRKVRGEFHGRKFQNDRDLYFAHRWNNGLTKEV